MFLPARTLLFPKACLTGLHTGGMQAGEPPLKYAMGSPF